MVSRRPSNLLRWPAALFEQSYNHSDFNYVFEQRQSSAECSIKKHTHTAYKCLPSHSLYIAIPHRDYSSVCGDLRIADLCNCHPWLMQSSMNTLTQLALDWMPKANSCEVRDVYSGAFFLCFFVQIRRSLINSRTNSSSLLQMTFNMVVFPFVQLTNKFDDLLLDRCTQNWQLQCDVVNWFFVVVPNA